MSADYLREATSDYLQRYSPSEQQLRQVLWRKIDKNIRLRGEGDRYDYTEMIDAEIEYRHSIGALNDEILANAWAESLHRRGKSAIQIRASLRSKGFSGTNIDQSFEQFEQSAEDLALEAAIVYARKKRLGPFQSNEEKRRARQKKDIASMIRAGHNYACVKRIMACSSESEAEELLEKGMD